MLRNKALYGVKINHYFTLEVVTKDFRSNDLEISRKNLRWDREQPTDILDRIDLPDVTERLRHLLEIRNLPEQSVRLSDAHIAEIREYLDLLDLTHEVAYSCCHPQKSCEIGRSSPSQACGMPKQTR